MNRSLLNQATLAGLLILTLLGGTSSLFAQFGGNAGGGGNANRRTGGAGNSSSTRQYYNNGTVGEAMISSDPETRRLIVITDEETSQFVSQVITNLDRPKPQVLIKVVFMEVTHNNSSDLGLEGSLSRKLGGSTIGAVTNLFGLTPGLPAGQGLSTPAAGGLYQVLGNDFQATLRAIAQAGKTEVLSRPSILTRNNQPATITVGQTLPFITAVTYNNLGNPINTVQYQDIGIILRVTPFINSDGMVEMIVSPEISSLTDQKITISSGVDMPVISKRSADTVVVTPDSQTVVIGGLMQTTKTKNDSKIPILGDIPLLGAAFKRKQEGSAKTELLIFLTPHIVRDPSQLAGLTSREKQDVKLAPKSFNEEDLNRFVDGLPMKKPEEPKKVTTPSKPSSLRPKDRFQ